MTSETEKDASSRGAGAAADWQQVVLDSLDDVIVEMQRNINCISGDFSDGVTPGKLHIDDDVALTIADLRRQIELVQQTKKVALYQFRNMAQ